MAENAIQHLQGEVAVLDPVKELHALDIMDKLPDAVLPAEP